MLVNNYNKTHMKDFDEIIKQYCVKKKIYYNDEAWVLKKKPRVQTYIRKDEYNEKRNTYLYQTRARPTTTSTGFEETEEDISETSPDWETDGEAEGLCSEGRIQEEAE